MTFDEYWYSCCDFHQCDKCDVTVNCAVDKAIAQSAWEAALPKWTLCKDGMPNYNEPCLLKIESSTGISIVCGYLEPYEPSEDEFGYGKVHTLDIFNVISVDCYSLVDSDPIDDERVIAWMSLPEYKEQTK